MYFREIGDFLPQFRHIILQMCIELISPLFRMRRRVLILSKLNRQYFKMGLVVTKPVFGVSEKSETLTSLLSYRD